MTNEEAIGVLRARHAHLCQVHGSLSGLLVGCTCSRPSNLDTRLEIAAQERDALALAIAALEAA